MYSLRGPSDTVWILLLYNINPLALNFMSQTPGWGAHIKMMHAFYKVTVQLLNCLHLLLLCHGLLPDVGLFLVSFRLVSDDDTALRLGRWHPAASSKLNLDSHFTDCGSCSATGLLLVAHFCYNKSLKEAERKLENGITLNWIFSNPSLIFVAEIDFPLCPLV